jgi:hypothetical protein
MMVEKSIDHKVLSSTRYKIVKEERRKKMTDTQTEQYKLNIKSLLSLEKAIEVKTDFFLL